MLSQLFASSIAGVSSISVENGQCLLKKGWYLVRATANSVDSRLSLVITEPSGDSVVYDGQASELVNTRLRTYVYTHGGVLNASGYRQLDLQRFPQWQVRFRTCLRVIRHAGSPNLSDLFYPLIAPTNALITIQSAIQNRRDIFADIDKLAQADCREVTVRSISFSDFITNADQFEDSDYLIFSKNNDIRLHPAAGKVLYNIKQKYGAKEILFSQHLNSSGECFLKPEFDPLYLSTFDFVGPALFWRGDKAKALFSHLRIFQPSDLLVALFKEVANDVIPFRIDEFLVQSDRRPEEISRNMLVSKYDRLETESVPSDPQRRKWVYLNSSNEPMVSIIIPTYNGLAYLKACVESLEYCTEYNNTEVIIVNNRSDDSATLDYLSVLAKNGYRVLDYPHPFNYSAINNFAAEHAYGDYLCLLNNDIEATDKWWLNKLVIWAMQPFVGAVGAKLHYADGRIQHAGVAVGMGNAAGHIHRYEKNDRPHLRHRVTTTQIVTAVTAACLVVNRDHFAMVNGLDETQLAVAYNDIDFCMKLNERGLVNVYCADATLNHYESVSRGDDMAPDKVKRYMRELRVFQRRWKSKRYLDRVMSKHQDRHSEQFPDIRSDRQL